MLEVDVNIAIGRERGEAFDKDSELLRGVGTCPAKAEAGERLRGMDFRSREIVAFCDAEGGVVRAENRVDFVAEPGFVTKFKGDGGSSRAVEGWGSEEAAETFGIGLEVWGKLEEEKTELARLPYDFQDRDEVGNVRLAVREALDVGDSLGRLEAEAEKVRGRGEPTFERGNSRKGAKGVVDLYGAELPGIELKKAFRRGAIRIKRRLPSGIGPAGGSCKDSRGSRCHGGFTRGRRGLWRSGHGL